MNGWQRSFQPVMNALILIIRSRTEVKEPRWIACFSRIENQTSTRFSQDPEVGVKWRCGSVGSRPTTLITSLSRGVPTALTELVTLGRTLKQRAVDVLAYFDRPAPPTAHGGDQWSARTPVRLRPRVP